MANQASLAVLRLVWVTLSCATLLPAIPAAHAHNGRELRTGHDAAATATRQQLIKRYPQHILAKKAAAILKSGGGPGP